MNTEWDAFGDPHSEDFQDHDLDESTEIHDPVGASPVSVADVSGKPNRKGLYMIVGAIVVFVAVWVFAKKFEKSDTPEDAKTPVAATANEAVATTEKEGDIDDVLDALPGDVRKDMERRQGSSTSGSLVDAPRTNGVPGAGSGDLFDGVGAPAPMQEPSAQQGGGDPIADALSGDEGLVVPPAEAPASMEQPKPAETGKVESKGSRADQSSQTGGDQYVEPGYMTPPSSQAALEQQLRREAEAKAREEAKRLERERLRASGTLVAESKDKGRTSPLASGPMREALEGTLGADQGAQVAAALGAVEAQSQPGVAGPAGVGQPSAQKAIQVTPGLKVQAVTVSEFIAGQQGAGVVEARLTSALRDRGTLLLPAGTRAFGDASSTSWSPGRDARVSITFHTFVTPDGQVLRNQLTASAADPQSLAMSVKGSVDHNYLSKIARGGAATAIDLLLTQDAQRRSVFDAPSPRDEALSDARKRLGGVLGADIGDETTDRPVVKLPAQTPIMLVFGLSDR